MWLANEGTTVPAIMPYVEAIATNQFFIGVIAPLLVTFLAVYVNWHLEGGGLRLKHWMIGSDLVICFSAIFFIHFFRVYRGVYLGQIDGVTFQKLILWQGVLASLTTPLLLSCIGMERASHIGARPVTLLRVTGNIALGALPLLVMSYFLTV
jgi:hypothetical protein